MKKILLHSCCAPCSVCVVEKLKERGFDPTIFWFNPNIHPFVEFKKRKEALEQLANELNLNFVDGGVYDIKKFLVDLDNEFEFQVRCQKCYFLRLSACVNFAKSHGFDVFTTTLLISPYQNHDQIRSLALNLAKSVDLEFYYYDFRPFFKQGQQKAREMGLYMQKYCGCVFSEEERFCNRTKKQLLKKLKAKQPSSQ